MRFLKLAAVALVLWAVFAYGSALGGLYGVLGYGLLAWVLVRAFPGCRADVAALFSLSSGLARRDRSNAGF